MIEARSRKDRQGRKWTSYRVGVRDAAGVKRWVTLPRGTTKAHAAAVEAQMKLSKHGDWLLQLLGTDDIEIADFVEGVWWTDYAERELAASTLSTYSVIWNRHLCPTIGAERLASFTSPMAATMRDQLLEAGVGTATVRKAMAMMQGVYTFAIEKGRAQFNPWVGVRKPRVARKRVIVPVDAVQVRKLVKAAEARGWHTDAMLIALLADIGARPGELLHAPWAHVKGRVLSIEATKTGTTRAATMSQAIANRLREYRLAAGRPAPETPIFARADGGFMRDHDYRNWRRRHFKDIVKDAGLEQTVKEPYDLRHHAASRYIADDMDVREVASQLGSSSETIWRNYVHLFKARDTGEQEETA